MVYFSISYTAHWTFSFQKIKAYYDYYSFIIIYLNQQAKALLQEQNPFSNNITIIFYNITYIVCNCYNKSIMPSTVAEQCK